MPNTSLPSPRDCRRASGRAGPSAQHGLPVPPAPPCWTSAMSTVARHQPHDHNAMPFLHRAVSPRRRMRKTRDLAAVPPPLSRFPRSPETPGAYGALRAACRSHRRLHLQSVDRIHLASPAVVRRPCDPSSSEVPRIVDRKPQIRLQRVIADVEHAARFALVAVAALEHEPRVAAAPRAQRVVALAATAPARRA